MFPRVLLLVVVQFGFAASALAEPSKLTGERCDRLCPEGPYCSKRRSARFPLAGRETILL